MPRGLPITPDQLALGAAAFARTGSYADAGRAMGRDESVARRALLRAMGEGGESDKVALNARAIERGMREGRRALGDLNAKLREKISHVSKVGEMVSIAKGLSLTVARQQGLAELELRRRQAALTRKKTRAEIRQLDKGAPTPEQIVAALAAMSREDLVATLTRLRPEPAALPASTPDPADPSP